MSDLRNILKEEYKKKEEVVVTPLSLIEMIEQVMVAPTLSTAPALNEAERFSMSIPMPNLVPNEAWGDPNSQSRKDIERIFASITREPSIQARIAHINSFVDPQLAKKKGTGLRFNAILNMMQIIEALQACLNDYSESSGGFVFEGFMAAVTGGKQISGRVGGTLPIEDFVTGDGEPVSLKLLSPNTAIHGSFTNLVDYLFIRGGAGVPEIKYLIARKNSDGDDVSELAIWDFIIDRSNFIDIMRESNNEAKLLGKMGPQLEQHIQAWQDSPEWRLKMFEILQQTPGYTENKGMFYKNLDDAGEFDSLPGGAADPSVKQRQYATAIMQGHQIDAGNQAEQDAAAGEPNFEAFLSKYKLQDIEDRPRRALERVYNKAFEQARQVAESYFGSFHEREKMLMKEERALIEGGGKEGGSQWSISRTEMTHMRSIATVQFYGQLDLSTQNIKACADIYIKKMGDDIMTLLETTKDFTENIGKYFSADRRSTAMRANQKAQEEGSEVVNLLAKDPVTATDTEA